MSYKDWYILAKAENKKEPAVVDLPVSIPQKKKKLTKKDEMEISRQKIEDSLGYNK